MSCKNAAWACSRLQRQATANRTGRNTNFARIEFGPESVRGTADQRGSSARRTPHLGLVFSASIQAHPAPTAASYGPRPSPRFFLNRCRLAETPQGSFSGSRSLAVSISMRCRLCAERFNRGPVPAGARRVSEEVRFPAVVAVVVVLVPDVADLPVRRGDRFGYVWRLGRTVCTYASCADPLGESSLLIWSLRRRSELLTALA